MWEIIKDPGTDNRYYVRDNFDGYIKGRILSNGKRWRVEIFRVPSVKYNWPTLKEAVAYVRGIEVVMNHSL